MAHVGNATADLPQIDNGNAMAEAPRSTNKRALPPIRSVGRALEILQIINRFPGINVMEIAERTKLPYATAYRMLMTLVHDGYVEPEIARKRYHVTELVMSLASGYQQSDALALIARPVLADLTTRIFWPVAVMVRVGSRMMVKESTHDLTTQTFDNYHPGDSFPIFSTASGKAYVAFCAEQERQLILKTAREFATYSGTGELRTESDYLRMIEVIEQISSDGYATQIRIVENNTPGKTSAIAVPVYTGSVAKCVLTLTYFDAAMPVKKAVEQYRQDLVNAAKEISDEWKKLC